MLAVLQNLVGELKKLLDDELPSTISDLCKVQGVMGLWSSLCCSPLLNFNYA